MNYNEDFETEEDFEEMEKPTACQKCDGWFDLHDGIASEKWFPRTVICSDCGEKEQNIIEIEQDIEDFIEEIDQAKDSITSAEQTIRVNTLKICALKEKLKLLEDQL